MTDQTQCPKCASEDIYADGNLWVCPMCSHEWSSLATAATNPDAGPANDDGGGVRDANGNPLADGDTVTVLKELKIKGATSAVKVGTKVKNIRLVDGPDNHDIQCKLDGVGTIYLKSEFVRKA